MIETMKRWLILLAMLLATGEAKADIFTYQSPDGSVHFTNCPVDKSGRIVYKEQQTPKESPKKEAAPVRAKREPSPRSFDLHSLVEEKARQHDMDPQLIKAVIKAESNGNPNAVSPKGACGLMQLMPGTASLLGVADIFDPEENVDGGTRYLKYLLEKFGGNTVLALAAYNAGPKRVEKKWAVPSIPETVAYVKKVMASYTGTAPITMTAQELQREIKKEYNRIKRFVQEDGTILFTNSYLATSYQKK
ncbi:MAG: transglycosylase SLT domain-containing protein [Nitrospirota bacterium]